MKNAKKEKKGNPVIENEVASGIIRGVLVIIGAIAILCLIILL